MKTLKTTGCARAKIDSITLSPSIPNNLEGLITLLDASTLVGKYSKYTTNYEISFFVVLEAITSTVYVNSIAPCVVPLIGVEDTPSERQRKIQEMEQRFPKLGIQILTDEGDGLGWVPKATFSLQNQKTEYYDSYLIPFLSTGEVKPIQPNFKLGLKPVDLGNGLPRGSDYLNLEICYSLQICFAQPMLAEIGQSGSQSLLLTGLLFGETRVVSIQTCKLGYALSLSASSTCRVRYYASAATASSDLNRAEGATFFSPGLCFDVIFGEGVDDKGAALSILSTLFKPNTVIVNQEDPLTPTGYLVVTNKASGSVDLSLNFRFLVIQQ